MASVVAALMIVQAVSGLVWRDQYRDVDWIRLTWLGNDCVTLLVAVPLLLWSSRPTTAPSVRSQLTVAGVLAYAVYNSAFYLFGAALNVFFPLYVMLFIGSTVTLVRVLTRTEVVKVLHTFTPDTPARSVGICLVAIGCGLTSVWLGFWAAHVFAGFPTPVETDAFRLVAALDLSLLVPLFIGGGLLLFRRRPWGFVLASTASVCGAIYLLVLALNSAIAIRSGLVNAPGELPLWGSLAGVTIALAAVMLAHARVESRYASC